MEVSAQVRRSISDLNNFSFINDIFYFASLIIVIGKTFLMDLFFKSLPTTKKKRVHFQTFMLELHQRLHNWQQDANRNYKGPNAITYIAKGIAEGAWVICFDEFQLNDPADIAIIYHLFTELLTKHQLVLVTTSNRAPSDFGQNAAQLRKLCIPLLQLMDTTLLPIELKDEDYRMQAIKGPGLVDNYLVPLNSETSTTLEKLFQASIGNSRTRKKKIQLHSGRLIVVNRSSKGVAFFQFDELCKEEYGAAEYNAIAANFHTVFISGIRKMDSKQRDQSRRFITLIDELYNAHVKLICSAEGKPHELFKDTRAYDPNIQELEVLDELKQNLFIAVPQWNREKYVGWLVSAQEVSFMFQRAVSRLLEMQSTHYHQLNHQPITISSSNKDKRSSK